SAVDRPVHQHRAAVTLEARRACVDYGAGHLVDLLVEELYLVPELLRHLVAEGPQARLAADGLGQLRAERLRDGGEFAGVEGARELAPPLEGGGLVGDGLGERDGGDGEQRRGEGVGQLLHVVTSWTVVGR